MVACNPIEDDCHHDSPTNSNGTANGNNHRGRHGGDDDLDPNPNGLLASTAGGGGKPWLAPTKTEKSYCGGGPNGWYNAFDCGATFTQDLALVIDAPFAGLEYFLIAIGCTAGPEGCLAGSGVGITVFNITGANTHETILSLIAAGSSVAADFYDDARFGESTTVAISGAVLGSLSPDPIIDFAIDGFGSAYNHEVKPISGIPSLISSFFDR